MEKPVIQRLIGAAVLALLAIIFLPMLLKSDVKAPDVSEVPLQMPKQPEVAASTNGPIETRELPLNVPGDAPAQGGVLGVPMTPVDAATGQPIAPSDTPELQNTPIATTQTPPEAQTAGPKSSALPDDALPTVKPVPSAQGEQAKTPPPTAVPQPKPNTGTAVAMPKPPRPVEPPVSEKPPTKPAKLPQSSAAAAVGNYTISIGSFSNLDNANALVTKLRAQNLPVKTEKVSINGKSAMKVLIGPYADRASAETDRLKADAIAGSVSKVAAQTTAPAAKPAEKSAEKSSEKPAAAAPAAGSGFSVQLEALSVEAEAMKMRDRARGQGFNAFVKRVETDKGTFYAVRLGPVADRDAANKLNDQAKQKLGKSGFVKSHP
jgi:DedD protein